MNAQTRAKLADEACWDPDGLHLPVVRGVDVR
jgi:hypothetical protein